MINRGSGHVRTNHFQCNQFWTLRVVDEYSKTQKISRSQVISTLLDATVPVLKDINRYYQLADELKARLLSGVYQQDLPRQRPVLLGLSDAHIT